MLEVDIKQLLEGQLENCVAEVQMEGNHLNLVVISSQFSGLNPVKKQQLVYGILQPYIASGEVHAVNMKTLTPDQVGS
ncbi:BolA family protein [Halioxenophilus sp. WMMB6]|uniref:BolA family protein n=1 Tax=Halioxenophilus sp. WMMB6 TaxID=3073815 RepID=UPI00295E7C85|nr:BolA/IbaG family iron-sulfur metabolism protein [Halioxenophilus sp. WMMB6]